MSRFLIASLIVLLCTVDGAKGEVRRVVFEGALSEHKWALKELNPDLPSDWSAYEYLVLEFASPYNLGFRRQS